MGRDVRKIFTVGQLRVSIHAPAWGATELKSTFPLTTGFQSTRPHGARPGVGVSYVDLLFVSIHAPAWGATKGAASSQHIKGVSIHAPAWGATLLGFQVLLVCSLFQSTRPHGARLLFTVLRNLMFSFNPRARMGRDRCDYQIVFTESCFNPRARMGRDVSKGYFCCQITCFNPRARMGRDLSVVA